MSDRAQAVGPETPEVGIWKGLLLVLPAGVAGGVLYEAAILPLGLPDFGYGLIAMILPLNVVWYEAGMARPADRRCWRILAVTSQAAGLIGWILAIAVIWLCNRLLPGLGPEIPVIATYALGSAAIILTFMAIDRLFCADNPIFPKRDRKTDGGPA